MNFGPKFLYRGSASVRRVLAWDPLRELIIWELNQLSSLFENQTLDTFYQLVSYI